MRTRVSPPNNRSSRPFNKPLTGVVQLPDEIVQQLKDVGYLSDEQERQCQEIYRKAGRQCRQLTAAEFGGDWSDEE
jgi:hypothetical protein